MISMDVTKVQSTLASLQETDSKYERCIQDLFDWTDSYNENQASSPHSAASIETRGQIVALWLVYVDVAIQVGDKQKALEVYEEAMGDEVAGTVSALYQKAVSDGESTLGLSREEIEAIYLKGLAMVTQEDELNTLWESFIAHKKKIGQFEEDGSVLDLYWDAKRKEPNINPSKDIMGSIGLIDDDKQDEADDLPLLGGKGDVSKESNTYNNKNCGVVGDFSPPKPLESMIVGNNKLTPVQLTDKYHHRPPSLFLASTAQVQLLSAEEQKAQMGGLSQFLDGASLTLDSNDPSRISANAIILLEEKWSWLLDLLEAMWVTQALKERTYHHWFVELKETTSNATRLNVNREIVTAVVHKALLSLLLEQEQVLSSLKFPNFNRKTKQDLGLYYHSNQVEMDESLAKRMQYQKFCVNFLIKHRVEKQQGRGVEPPIVQFDFDDGNVGGTPKKTRWS